MTGLRTNLIAFVDNLEREARFVATCAPRAADDNPATRARIRMNIVEDLRALLDGESLSFPTDFDDSDAT